MKKPSLSSSHMKMQAHSYLGRFKKDKFIEDGHNTFSKDELDVHQIMGGYDYGKSDSGTIVMTKRGQLDKALQAKNSGDSYDQYVEPLYDTDKYK